MRVGRERPTNSPQGGPRFLVLVETPSPYRNFGISSKRETDPKSLLRPVHDNNANNKDNNNNKTIFCDWRINLSTTQLVIAPTDKKQNGRWRYRDEPVAAEKVKNEIRVGRKATRPDTGFVKNPTYSLRVGIFGISDATNVGMPPPARWNAPDSAG